MEIKIGPYPYQVKLANQPINVPGVGPSFGSCDPMHQKIQVWKGVSAPKRLGTLWHEIGEAAAVELDISNQNTLDVESFCNLLGLVMAGMTPLDLARLHIMMTQCIEAKSVVMVPGCDQAIPVIPLDLSA